MRYTYIFSVNVRWVVCLSINFRSLGEGSVGIQSANPDCVPSLNTFVDMIEVLNFNSKEPHGLTVGLLRISVVVKAFFVIFEH